MEAVDVVSLFEEILGIDDVLAEDNFFDVGGNSLSALTLLAEIEKRWDVALALIDVIRAPTSGQVAELIRRGVAGGRPPGPAQRRQAAGG